MPEAKKTKLKTKLKPHQQRVVDRLMQANQPGLLAAHPLGSGKTLTSIAAAQRLAMPTEAIVPAALQENFAKELRKHVEGDLPINISSQQKLTRGGSESISPGGLQILDEAHRARNFDTLLGKTLRKVPADKRLLLTASPLYNNPADIATPINLAAGEKILPENPREFRDRYIQELQVSPGFLAKLFNKAKPGVRYTVNPSRKKELQDIFSKFVDYVPPMTEGYPEQIDETINVDMTPKQEDYYKAIIGSAPSWVKYKIMKGLPPSKQESKQLNAYLSGVRQLSNTTRAFQTDGEEQAPKIDAAVGELQKMLKANPQGKAVVYSNYLASGIDPYRERLDKANIPYGAFTGGMTNKQRKALVEDYNTNKIKALLLSSAGGEGLDLKGTRLMQILDPHFNNEKLRQVIGRGVRYQSHEGLPEQDRNVRVQRFQAQHPEPGALRRFLGAKRPKGVDEYLAMMSGDKDALHQQFRELIERAQQGVNKKYLVEKTGGVDDQTFSVDSMTYPTKALHEKINEIPTTTVPISAFAKHMDKKVWNIEHPDHEGIRYSPKQIVELINSGSYQQGDKQQHSKRIAAADMSYPIIVAGWNNVILDGHHRLAKALAEGHKSVSVKVLPEIPEHLKQLGVPTTKHLSKKAFPGHEFSTSAEGKNRRYDVHQGGKNIAHAIVHPKSTEGDGPWISGLYVKPEHRGHGLAKKLLGKVEKDHAGQTIRLRARPYSKTNDGQGLTTKHLVSAYKRWGYKPYDPDEPTRLMKEASNPLSILAATGLFGAMSMMPIAGTSKLAPVKNLATHMGEASAQKTRRDQDLASKLPAESKTHALPPPKPPKSKLYSPATVKPVNERVPSLPKHTWGKYHWMQGPDIKDKALHGLSKVVPGVQPPMSTDVTGSFFKRVSDTFKKRYRSGLAMGAKYSALIDRVENSVEEITKQAAASPTSSMAKSLKKITTNEKLWKQRPALISNANAGKRRLMDPSTENNSRQLAKALL